MNTHSPSDFTPFFDDAEKALLRCCLFEEQGSTVLARCVARGVTADWFYTSDHQCFWIAMNHVVNSGIALTEITLSQCLHSTKAKLTWEIGPLLNELLNIVETPAHVHNYLNIVQQHWMHRNALREAQLLLETLKQPVDSIAELTTIIQAPITRLSQLSLTEDGDSLKKIAAELIERTQREIDGEILEEDRARWIYTGLPGVDERFYPLNPDSRDNLIVIAATPSTGKSALANQIMFHNLQAGKICFQCTLETSRQDVLKQMAAQHVGIDLRAAEDEGGWAKIAGEDGGRQKIALYQQTLQWLHDRCEETLFIFEDARELSVIAARFREVLAKTGRIDLGITDHCHLVEVSDEKNMQTHEKLGKISATHKALAKDNRMVWILICQLNRDIPESGPVLGNLRASGDLEANADRAWLLHRPRVDANGNTQGEKRAVFETEINQAKFKNGPKRRGKLGFRAAYTRFQDLSGFVEGTSKRGRNPGDQKNLGEKF